MPSPLIAAAAAAAAADVPLAAIETALVQLFCQHHGLAPSSSSVLARLVDDRSDKVVAARRALLSFPGSDSDTSSDTHSSDTHSSDTHSSDTHSSGLATISLDDLVMAFETLVPAEEAKKYGAVFTPETVTAFMADEAVRRAKAQSIDIASATAVDPAVGCGALLVAALRRLHADPACAGQSAGQIAGRLFGCDISLDSVRRARILLSLSCLFLGDASEPDLSRNLRVADALSADWAGLFGTETFQLVLGNPPYVRFQQLDRDLRVRLSRSWDSCRKGNFNLYFPFFELSHTLADPKGSVVALITPNAYLSGLSGGPLRAWMCRERFVSDVADFGHHRVFEALTYTAVTFSQRRPGPPADSFGYARIDGLAGLAELPDDWASSCTTPTPWAGLSAAPWRLVGRSAARATAAVIAGGVPLATLADIRFGVATCRDRLYLLSGDVDADGFLTKSHRGVTYRLEPGLTRLCARVSSLPNQAALDADRTRILFPYTAGHDGVAVMAEDILAERFPEAFRYLSAVRPELAARDGGLKTYPAWFAYARTQGLSPAPDRLLTPLYAGAPRFLRESRPGALFVNGCSVSLRADAPDWVSLDLIALLLRSGVCHFFIESTSNAIDGGFFAYQKAQLGRFTVPRIDQVRLAELSALPAGEQDDELAGLFGIDLPPRYRRA